MAGSPRGPGGVETSSASAAAMSPTSAGSSATSERMRAVTPSRATEAAFSALRMVTATRSNRARAWATKRAAVYP